MPDDLDELDTLNDLGKLDEPDEPDEPDTLNGLFKPDDLDEPDELGKLDEADDLDELGKLDEPDEPDDLDELGKLDEPDELEPTWCAGLVRLGCAGCTISTSESVSYKFTNSGGRFAIACTVTLYLNMKRSAVRRFGSFIRTRAYTRPLRQA